MTFYPDRSDAGFDRLMEATLDHCRNLKRHLHEAHPDNSHLDPQVFCFENSFKDAENEDAFFGAATLGGPPELRGVRWFNFVRQVISLTKPNYIGFWAEAPATGPHYLIEVVLIDNRDPDEAILRFIWLPYRIVEGRPTFGPKLSPAVRLEHSQVALEANAVSAALSPQVPWTINSRTSVRWLKNELEIDTRGSASWNEMLGVEDGTGSAPILPESG